MTASLCLSCRHVRRIVSGKGSQFLLCQLAAQDRRYPKYPPQPVVKCSGYLQAAGGAPDAAPTAPPSGQ